MGEQIRTIVSRQLRIDLEDIEDDADIIEDLGADSLDAVEMIMAIEDDFGVTIPDEDIIELRTVRDIAEYVENCT